MTLEEKYLNVSRERREPAPRPRPEGRREEERWDEPPRRRKKTARPAPARQKAKPRRSRAASIGLGCYKALVVVSAIIVAAYVGLQLMSKAPEQKAQGNNNPDADVATVGDVSVDTSQEEDPNALVRREDVFTILLAGTDKEGYRTDTMMVMCYDTANQKVGVVSVPRDTITQRDGHAKLAYGSGGVTQRMEDIYHMLGVPIDYYVKVDINGFIALVDYLGGVELDIPLDMNYDDPTPGQELHIHFTKGTHLLDGQGAMEAVRYRHDNKDSPNYDANQWYSDVQRTQLQQQLLTKLAKKVLSWDSLTKISGFVEIFNENVETDLKLSEMLWLAQKAVDLDLSTGVETATLEGRGDATYNGYTWCYELDAEKAVETVNRLINPYTRDLTLEDMNIVSADSYYYNY